MAQRVCSMHGHLVSGWRWPARGRVLSIHRRAVNLLFAGGALLSLVAPEQGNGPDTIVVAGDWPLPIAEGTPVRLAGGALRLGGGLTLPLGGAVLWRPAELPAAQPSPALPIAQLARAGHPAGLLPAALAALRLKSHHLPTAAAARALSAIAADGIALLGARRWADGVARLAGLGPGLTPAGDDLLCGYLIALHRARHPAAADLSACIAAVPHQATPPISHHFLRWSTRGVAGEHHLAWVDSLLCGRPLPMRTVIAHGATSGTDWAAGALLALHHHVIKESRHDGQAV